jgi:hypothetical protein
MKPPAFSKSVAIFSPCERYRYTLERWWSPLLWEHGGRYVNFLLLNPSTADAAQSDPTVTRCIHFARDWGFDGLLVTNIFALRSTDPKELKKAEDPVGPKNNQYILSVARKASLVVCGYGNWGELYGRGRAVTQLLWDNGIDWKCLGVTKQAYPRHPLYVRRDAVPEIFA